MVSINTRIQREIILREQERQGIQAQLRAEESRAQQRVRGWIRDDLLNLWYRFKDNNRGKRDDVPRWLHTKVFDETYIDLGPEGKSIRTREHVQLMLNYLEGDSARFLELYAEELNRAFPIKGSFEWAPALVVGITKSGRPVLTVKYRWRRIRHVEQRPEE